MSRVVGTCGPRHRSLQTVSPLRVEVVVDGQLGAADLHHVRRSPSPPFSPISSSLYGSAASSAGPRASVTTRREKRWPALMISLHPLLERGEIVRA